MMIILQESLDGLLELVGRFADDFQILIACLGTLAAVSLLAAILITLIDILDSYAYHPPNPKAISIVPSLSPSPPASVAKTKSRSSVPSTKSSQSSSTSPLCTTGNHRSYSNSNLLLFSSSPPLQSIQEQIREDQFDCWWDELDSQTQYYALILSYTKETWDRDFELEDLPCEDWYWEEMSQEQKTAAAYFGYSEETWDEDSSTEGGDDDNDQDGHKKQAIITSSKDKKKKKARFSFFTTIHKKIK